MTTPYLIVVDDEPEIGELVRILAKDLGFLVAVASSAEQAIRLCADAQPDVILMDMVMPEADGIDLLCDLSACAIEAKIILMSGFNGRYLRMGKTLGKTRGLNVVDTIEKPFRLQELSGLLQKALDDGVSRKAS